MATSDSTNRLVRRSFLSRLGLGLTGTGIAAGSRTTAAQVISSDAVRWSPAHHVQDDWLDQVPGKHRFVLDTTTPEGLGNALAFTSNYFVANQNAYGLKDADLAVVIVVRHNSTPFAYNDAMWAKYGAAISQRNKFVDPKTMQPPSANLFNSRGYGDLLTNRGTVLDGLLVRGVQLAVCQMATRAYASAIAGASGGNTEAIYTELVANLVGGTARMVPAGIVAVNRAQERGYSLACSV
jgi:hypothetical protein